jgi:chorismate synthase
LRLSKLNFLTAGESHGPGLTGIIEGLPAGLEISEEDIRIELARRQQGYGRGRRMAIESDYAHIHGGVRHGRTLGSPISLFIENKDWDHWKNRIMQIEAVENKGQDISLPRPGHADFAGAKKFGFTDIRNVIERSSARETAMRVALGAIAKKFLEQCGIFIGSHVLKIGSASLDGFPTILDASTLNAAADTSQVRCLDDNASKRMIAEIDMAKDNGDSLGGIFQVVATGVPIGLGSYTHLDKKLNTRISAMIMSINAIKAMSMGDGFLAAELRGSEFHDEWDEANNLTKRKSNHAGGIEGGMSNGMPIVVNAIMKPIPTLTKPLQSVDMKSGELKLAHKERTDVVAVPAAAVIGESMLALVMADAILEKFGGDSMNELLERLPNQ